MGRALPVQPEIDQELFHLPISNDLAENIRLVQTVFSDCDDVIIYQFTTENGIMAAILYIRGMVNVELLDGHILDRLKSIGPEPVDSYSRVKEHLAISESHELENHGELLNEILVGKPVLLLDTFHGALSLSLMSYKNRAVEEPLAESVVRGAREGFIESMSVNTMLLRRRLKTPALKFVSYTVGRYSKTNVTMAYIQGIAKPEVIKQLADKLLQIDIDGVAESGIIEEFIEGNNYSPFPQLQTTERPDVAAASLLEGRVLILTDNTPIVLIAPTTFWSMMQSPEDYYQRFLIGTLIRWLRYTFFLISLLAPAIYVAVLTFHQEMVPTTLLLRIAKSREEIPFPALLEALIMEVTFEALREAGVRLPRQVGSAVSIVGALVIGQAAIQAGLVSAPMVMVVAITGISSFMIPQYPTSIALRMLRFPIMLMSGLLGLFGLILCVLFIISHLCTLKSFGVPYLAPLAPINTEALKDVLIRAPLKKTRFRPTFYAGWNLQRQGDHADDSKPKEE